MTRRYHIDIISAELQAVSTALLLNTDAARIAFSVSRVFRFGLVGNGELSGKKMTGHAGADRDTALTAVLWCTLQIHHKGGKRINTEPVLLTISSINITVCEFSLRNDERLLSQGRIRQAVIVKYQ